MGKLAFLRLGFLFLGLVCNAGVAQTPNPQVINITSNRPPQSILAPNGELTGLAVDLGRALYSDASFVPGPLPRAVAATRDSLNTLIFIYRSPERESDFKWVAPIYSSPVYVYVPKGWVAQHGVDINLITPMGVQFGSALMQTLNSKQYNGKVATNTSNDVNLQLLKAGRLGGWIEAQMISSYVMKSQNVDASSFDKIGPLTEVTTWLATSARSDDAFISETRKRVAKLQAKRSYVDIVERYNAKPVLEK